MTEALLFCLAAAAFGVLLVRWWLESRRHLKRLSGLGLRIHVNGIRGKSTVTRIIAGMLREAGVQTIAKSTGTAAAVINHHGHDEPIRRRGAATLLEQKDVVRSYIDEYTEAIVVECMALKPSYQSISEAMIIYSNIGVITNVREDHQDVLGETLPEIARSLLSTCPRNGVLVTSERNPEIQLLMQEEARLRGSSLLIADANWVSDDDIARFEYIAFKENVAIGLAVAFLLGIPRDIAMDGMVRAAPDPGVLTTKELVIGGKRVTWANLFAVNDRESMVLAMEKLRPLITADTITVGILNNRADRERRALQFADVAVRDLSFDRLVTFGAYEDIVTQRLIRNGYPGEHIINLGEGRKPTQEDIIRDVVLDMPKGHIFLCGFVNIHTIQAEMLLHYFEALTGAPQVYDDENSVLIDDPSEEEILR